MGLWIGQILIFIENFDLVIIYGLVLKKAIFILQRFNMILENKLNTKKLILMLLIFQLKKSIVKICFKYSKLVVYPFSKLRRFDNDFF